MKNCDCHKEISRDGSSQLSRFLKALDPNYVQIDDRSIEEILVFIKRYAAQIRFYELPSSANKGSYDSSKLSWSEFFRWDMAVVASSLALFDLEQIKEEYDENRQEFDADPGLRLFGNLFDPIIGMASKIDHWYSATIEGGPLRNDLKLAIDSNLRNQMRKIRSYEEGYRLIDEENRPLKLNYTAIINRELWGLEEAPEIDHTLYRDGATVAEKIRNAALNIDDIFHSFFGFINNLQNGSEKYLEFAIEKFPAHKPHMALFIAFLKLFALLQQQANGLTERMLDFYYRDVLHLESLPSIPDKVYVVFSLAKDVTEYPVAKETILKAGPDNSGKEQLYITSEEIVVNEAKVKELKTIFIEKTHQDQEDKDQTVHTIYARPVANSLDGLGAKFTDLNPKWPTFGIGSPHTKGKSICDVTDTILEQVVRNDQAKIGFAIASPQLLMQGGKRLIRLTLRNGAGLFAAQENLTKNGLGNLFEIWLTGEKKWFAVKEAADKKDLFNDILGKGIFHDDDSMESVYSLDGDNLWIYLPESEQGVIAYDSDLHKDYTYGTRLPVMQLLINPIIDLNSLAYNKLRANQVSLTIKVGSILPLDDKREFQADGLQKLVLQNETGLLPINKPFDPFTAYPLKGKAFYIGSDEVFNKPLEGDLGKLAVFIQKTQDVQDVPGATGNFMILMETHEQREYRLSVLERRKWKLLSDKNGNDFKSPIELRDNVLQEPIQHAAGTPPASRPVTHPRLPILPVTEWDTQTEKGFLRLTNLIRVNPDLQARQEMAASMEIKEVSLSYVSELPQLDSAVDEFYHVYPFGTVQTFINTPEELKANHFKVLAAGDLQIYSERRKRDRFSELDKKKDFLLVDAKNILLPQFTYQDPYEKYKPPVAGQQPTEPAYSAPGEGSCEDLRGMFLEDKITDGYNQYSALFQEEGILFIGLENLKPLSNVSLLFQFADGSAEDEDQQPPPIRWSYLTNNEWRPLKADNLISDGTYGFQTTGIVKLEVPADITNNNTIITTGLHWFCASVKKDSNRIPRLVDVVTQAVEAAFKDSNNDPTHFDKALPAGSISKLETAVAEIDRVKQPFASFNGKHKETSKEFYPRVSERLRHKGRAITSWDYEHLVLERFPSIYKVKCITHTDPECLCRHPEKRKAPEKAPESVAEIAGAAVSPAPAAPPAPALVPGAAAPAPAAAPAAQPEEIGGTICCGPQVAPGHVLIVPISNLKNRNAIDPLRPKTGRRTLIDIENYLKKLTSPFVHVHAKNPIYDQIIVAFRVKFYTGTDKGYYLKQLNKDIVDFLTPWAYDENAEVKFGEKIYASSIINFIEERDYVDFITDFVMCVCTDKCCPEVVYAKEADKQENKSLSLKQMLETACGCDDIAKLMNRGEKFIGEVVATPSGPRSLLVSAPQHIIVPYEEDKQPTPCEIRKSKKNP